MADLYCWRIYGFFWPPTVGDNYDRPSPGFPLPENLKEHDILETANYRLRGRSRENLEGQYARVQVAISR